MGTHAAFIPDVFSQYHRHTVRPQIDLNGVWEFRRDPYDEGADNGWHTGNEMFGQTIRIPGVPHAQGIGEPHVQQKTWFDEPFWVRRSFAVPALAEGKRLWLRTGGILPAAEVYVNGAHVGSTQSSRTQQRIDITQFVQPDAENHIAVMVRGLPEVRLDGIWEYGESGVFWSGVYGPVSCEVAHEVSVVDVYVQPQLPASSAKVWLQISQPADQRLTVRLRVLDGKRLIGRQACSIGAGEREVETTVPLRSFIPWSPEHPKLYLLELTLRPTRDGEPLDRVGMRFGMREIRAEGTKFILNGNPVFVRGYGEDQLYVETLCPPADPGWFVPRLKRARAYGMNTAKGCVEVLPQSYLEGADEAGIMVIQEMPFGLSGLRANRHTIDGRFREYYRQELDGIVRVSRNNASVIAYSMSSEMGFAAQTQESFDFFNRELVDRTRSLAPHALVIDCTGYVEEEETSKGARHTDFYASCLPPNWAKDVLDERDVRTDGKHPLVLHEYNWWSCYPDPADREQYVATQISPFWLDELERTARQNGQEHLIPTYRKNSLWLQALCRKDGIEYARRNPKVEGYLLWLLVDYGQYTEGLFDDFWQSKPNTSAEEFLQCNGDTVVVLAREGNRCVQIGGTLTVPFAVSHYGEADLSGCVLCWEAVGQTTFARGGLSIPRLVQGGITEVGSANVPVPNADEGYRFEIRVSLVSAGRTVNTNQWSFWAMPPTEEPSVRALAEGRAGSEVAGVFLRTGPSSQVPIPEHAGLVMASAADDALANYVERGGRCVLLCAGATLERPHLIGERTSFYDYFRTIPWNVGTTGNSGTVITKHPALDRFPHDDRCDLQFVHLIRGACPMDADWLSPHGGEPIIRAIDHYKTNRNNAYLVEFRVGKGRVIATTLGILDKLATHVEARALMESLGAYAQSEQFDPKATIPRGEFIERFGLRPDAEGKGSG